MEFNTADLMLTGLGRVDLWHTELADLYGVDDEHRRRTDGGVTAT